MQSMHGIQSLLDTLPQPYCVKFVNESPLVEHGYIKPLPESHQLLPAAVDQNLYTSVITREWHHQLLLYSLCCLW